MSIGNSLLLSVPVLGTTTKTLTKLTDGYFSVSLTPISGYPSIPFIVKLRPSAPSAVQKGLGCTLQYNPSAISDELHPSLGKVGVTINATSTLGIVVTDTVLKSAIKETCSVLCTDSVLDALVQGSME